MNGNLIFSISFVLYTYIVFFFFVYCLLFKNCHKQAFLNYKEAVVSFNHQHHTHAQL